MTISCDFAHVRALCIGDVMLDRFITGSVRRISPESPVPIIALSRELSVPGGAANVARNIAALGGHCTLVGVLGEDAVGAELIRCLHECGGVTTIPLTVPGRPTTEKSRFVAQGQQLLRADREVAAPVASADAQRLIAAATEVVARHDVVILSDYAKGVLTEEVVMGVIAAARAAGVPVVVDPKTSSLAHFAGATVITPNLAEAALATGIEAREDADAVAAGERILADADLGAVLLTRSERGMTLVRRDAEALHVAASAREVFDVSGAGDTVVATLAMSIGAGHPLEEAARLANAAAGLVVGKRGTATVTASELRDELSRLSRQAEAGPVRKHADLEAAVAQRRLWEYEGLSVGFTNGCFDVLHLGHVRILDYARSCCDRLIVGLNSDASVKRLKGPTRPIHGQDDRAEILAALSAVDMVVVFDEDTPLSAIEALQPDVLVKGSDYRVEDVVGADVVQRRGGQVMLFDLVDGRSTTKAIERGNLTAAAAE